MKYLLPIIFSLTLLSACRSKENTVKVSQEKEDTVIAGPAIPAPLPSPIVDSSPNTPPRTTPDLPKIQGDSLPFTGRHNFTLQWIGWNIPGLVFISRDTAGWFRIRGQQQSKDGYVKIDGLVKPVDVVELMFRGEIRSKVSFINNGEECLRKGQYWFISTQGRKYWRLQQMINCEGGRVTDYIDIYF